MRLAAGSALLGSMLLAACASLPRTGEASAGASTADPSNRILVVLAPGTESSWRGIAAQMQELERVRLVVSWFMRSLDAQCLVVEPPGGRDAADVAGRLVRWPRIAAAAPVSRYRVLGDDGSDPYRHLQRIVPELELTEAHRHATGKGVQVALVDTGIDVEHPDLVGSITRARDFVGEGGKFTSDWHGTAVAGVLAARSGNGAGVVGVAPDAEIWALKACWQEPPSGPTAVCDSYTLAQALDAAIVAHPRILNLSLAGSPDPLIERLLDVALERGIFVVAAAEGSPPSFPASIPGVLAVYSWRDGEPVSADEPAMPPAALAAPGVDILTTIPRGGYDFVSGSSFAAAQASGIAALALALKPDLSPREVASLLTETARRPDRAGPSASRESEVRLLDACRALARLRSDVVCRSREPQAAPTEGGDRPTPAGPSSEAPEAATEE